MKEKFDAADDLDGFEDLKEDDQEKIRTAWEAGKVADEDIPESAQKADGEGDEEEEDGASKKKAKKADGPAKFKLEYAASGRAKCKGGCDGMLFCLWSYALWSHPRRKHRQGLSQTRPRSRFPWQQVTVSASASITGTFVWTNLVPVHGNTGAALPSL